MGGVRVGQPVLGVEIPQLRVVASADQGGALGVLARLELHGGVVEAGNLPEVEKKEDRLGKEVENA
jgi:hypothetical protein